MATSSRSRLQVKRAGAPDESRPFKAHGHADVHTLGGSSILRGIFEPGWKWSVDVKPIAGTTTCEAPHVLYVVSGRMRIRMDDGQEEEVGPGDLVKVEPGHDAWVVGDERCEVIDFGGYEQYAKPASAMPPKQQRGGERTSVS